MWCNIVTNPWPPFGATVSYEPIHSKESHDFMNFVERCGMEYSWVMPHVCAKDYQVICSSQTAKTWKLWISPKSTSKDVTTKWRNPIFSWRDGGNGRLRSSSSSPWWKPRWGTPFAGRNGKSKKQASKTETEKTSAAWVVSSFSVIAKCIDQIQILKTKLRNRARYHTTRHDLPQETLGLSKTQHEKFENWDEEKNRLPRHPPEHWRAPAREQFGIMSTWWERDVCMAVCTGCRAVRVDILAPHAGADEHFENESPLRSAPHPPEPARRPSAKNTFPTQAFGLHHGTQEGYLAPQPLLKYQVKHQYLQRVIENHDIMCM